MRVRIYVAGPYTPHTHTANLCIRETYQNVMRAIHIGNALVQKGHYVFVPHLSHFMANEEDGTHSATFWYDEDNTFIEHWATALFYISPSKGADAELALAKKVGLKIFRSLEEVPMDEPFLLATKHNIRKDLGRKDDQGKKRFDLIPVLPLWLLAEVYTIGARKYADRNWEKGIQFSRIFAALQRHAWRWWGREQNDQTDSQHHLASVAWCAMSLMEYEQTHHELDDRPRKVKLT